MTNKHTQGEWIAMQANPSGNNKWLVCEARNYGEGICQLDNEANARLIAASPMLLEALEAINALINGEYDNPALLAFGELSVNRSDDIKRICEQAIKAVRGV